MAAPVAALAALVAALTAAAVALTAAALAAALAAAAAVLAASVSWTAASLSPDVAAPGETLLEACCCQMCQHSAGPALPASFEPAGLLGWTIQHVGQGTSPSVPFAPVCSAAACQTDELACQVTHGSTLQLIQSWAQCNVKSGLDIVRILFLQWKC